jgi:predicted glycoside hydrolase/deacetylase ChbG (UPF0249 family)
LKQKASSGVLVINADDWGRDKGTTQRTLECLLHGSVSSVSAMVFMADSERAAELASANGVDAGLHLNLTTQLSGTAIPHKLKDQQEKLTSYLRGSRLLSTIYHPLLARSFEYVVESQLEEFRTIYGREPARIDGHHHMHLCANVLMAGLLPSGLIVRRNFSFAPGEKSFANRLYRKVIDGKLKRRHRITDFFFSLPPMDPARLTKIFALATDHTVEVECHPANAQEHSFLMTMDVESVLGGVKIARGYTI